MSRFETMHPQISRRRLVVATVTTGALLLLWSYNAHFRRTQRSYPALLGVMASQDAAATLITLDPVREPAGVDRETLRGWPVLGRTPLTRSEALDLLTRISNSVSSDWNDYPSCFEPRHALRVERGFGWAEILVCFECGQMVSVIGMGPVTIQRDHMILSRDERAAFNAVAKARGLQVAPPVVGDPNRG